MPDIDGKPGVHRRRRQLSANTVDELGQLQCFLRQQWHTDAHSLCHAVAAVRWHVVWRQLSKSCVLANAAVLSVCLRRLVNVECLFDDVRHWHHDAFARHRQFGHVWQLHGIDAIYIVLWRTSVGLSSVGVVVSLEFSQHCFCSPKRSDTLLAALFHVAAAHGQRHAPSHNHRSAAAPVVRR